MTKVILLATLAFCSVNYTNAKCYSVTYHNLTPAQADKGVREAFTDVYNNGEDNQLNCYNSGDKVCKFSDGTCPSDVKISLEEIKTEVQAQIDFGTSTGIQVISTGYYTWNATDLNNITLSYYTND
jgi:hypothetical protein